MSIPFRSSSCFLSMSSLFSPFLVAPIMRFYLTTFTIFNIISMFHTTNGLVVGRILSLHQNSPSITERLMLSQPSSFVSLLPSYYTSNGITPSYLSYLASQTKASMLKFPSTFPLSSLDYLNHNQLKRNFEQLSNKHNNQNKYITPLQLNKPQTNTPYLIGVNRRNSRSSKTNKYSENELTNLATSSNIKIPNTYAKKSTLLAKSLKKFSSSGSRNCFFTPIQCMIQHDMSKYRKLVDSNSMHGTTLAEFKKIINF